MKRRDFIRYSALGSIYDILLRAFRTDEPLHSGFLSQQDRVITLLDRGDEGLSEAIALIRNSSESRMREVAAFIVGNSGSDEYSDLLLGALADPAERVRRAALIALQKILYPKAVGIEHSDTAVLPPPETPPQGARNWGNSISATLHDGSPLVRALAAQTLGWLRCQAAAPDLETCLKDKIEPVRFYAAHALQAISGRSPDFSHPNDPITYYNPSATVGPPNKDGILTQLSPFLRASFFEKQGKFTFLGGIPARSQSRVLIWWQDGYLCFKAECEDHDAPDDGDDRLTILLEPELKSTFYLVEITPKGITKQVAMPPGQPEQDKDFALNAASERDERGWSVQLSISLESLGQSRVPLGQAWRANLIRFESHHSPGFGPETSSWAYSGIDSLAANHWGYLYFAETASAFSLRAERENVYEFPLDRYSATRELSHPIRVNEATWGRIIPPEHLARGDNAFRISMRSSNGARKLTLRALDRRLRTRIATSTRALPGGAPQSNGEINLVIPSSFRERAVDLEIVLSDTSEEHEMFRTCIPAVPLVSPPSRVSPYPLKLNEKVHLPAAQRPMAKAQWQIRDLGPMQMNESYPMSLVEGRDTILYGGTYPGGRLFSFDLTTGTLEDLGSAGPPANHLHDLVASPDGRIYGGLYRPEGKLFCYDPSTKSTMELGVPVSGAFSGSCQVMAWSHGRIYGIQRSHLFYAETNSHRIVDKGNFWFDGAYYLPTTIASDSKGNLLGVAGGRLFRYLPEKDQVLISDIEFEGWLLNCAGSLYCFYPDGRLFIWKPEVDQLHLVFQYAPVPTLAGEEHKDDPYGPIEIVLRRGGELVVARSGVTDATRNRLYVHEPEASGPIDLGNPIPGALYLTALTVTAGDVVFGLSTQIVYGLGRTPARLYSLSQS